MRQAQTIPNKETVEFVVCCNAATAALLEPMQPYFTQMARATVVEMSPEAEFGGWQVTKAISGFDGLTEVRVDAKKFIDVEAEKARLGKDRDKLTKFVGSLNGKLSNEKFVANAPAEVVEAERAKLAEAQSQIASIEAALAKLG